MPTHDDILRAIGRIEGELVEIRKLNQRVRHVEIWLSWLKGGWAALAALWAYLASAFRGRLPALKIPGFPLLLPLLLSATACATYLNIHPGALNKTDSAAYDTLQIAETTIDQARLNFQTGQLPAETKNALDALIRSYNVARESWLTYRGAIATNIPVQIYFDQLTKNLSDLTIAIRNFEEVFK